MLEDDLLHIPLSCVWNGNGLFPKCMPISEMNGRLNKSPSTIVYESKIWQKKYLNFSQIFGCDTNKYKNYINDIKEIYICKEFCIASGFGPFYQLILLFTIILNIIDYNFLS